MSGWGGVVGGGGVRRVGGGVLRDGRRGGRGAESPCVLLRSQTCYSYLTMYIHNVGFGAEIRKHDQWRHSSYNFNFDWLTIYTLVSHCRYLMLRGSKSAWFSGGKSQANNRYSISVIGIKTDDHYREKPNKAGKIQRVDFLSYLYIENVPSPVS